MKKSDCAVQCFSNGFNCAQAVFSAYCGDLGLEQETALKIACGFGAGMGRTGETCGAVTGAIMLIGLKHGKVKPEDNEARENTYILVQEFIRRFKAINHSIQCKELLDCDISTVDGMQSARDKQLFQTICPKMVKDASEIVEELLGLRKDEY